LPGQNRGKTDGIGLNQQRIGIKSMALTQFVGRVKRISAKLNDRRETRRKDSAILRKFTFRSLCRKKEENIGI